MYGKPTTLKSDKIDTYPLWERKYNIIETNGMTHTKASAASRMAAKFIQAVVLGCLSQKGEGKSRPSLSPSPLKTLST